MATPAWTPNDAPAVPAVAALADTAAPAIAPSTPARQPSVARPSYREPGERPAWLLPVIAGVVILLLIGIGGGIYLATHRGSTTSVVTRTPTPPKPSPKVSPTPTSTGGPQAVPTYAPASAAAVTNVAFCIQPTHLCSGLTAPDYTNCRLNSSCKVMVEIKFSSPQHGKVAYIVKFFDRCTGTTTDLPGNGFTPNGFTRVDIQRALSLPSGAKSAALVAVTTSPAAAASAPLLLGGDAC